MPKTENYLSDLSSGRKVTVDVFHTNTQNRTTLLETITIPDTAIDRQKVITKYLDLFGYDYSLNNTNPRSNQTCIRNSDILTKLTTIDILGEDEEYNWFYNHNWKENLSFSIYLSENTITSSPTFKNKGFYQQLFIDAFCSEKNYKLAIDYFDLDDYIIDVYGGLVMLLKNEKDTPLNDKTEIFSFNRDTHQLKCFVNEKELDEYAIHDALWRAKQVINAISEMHKLKDIHTGTSQTWKSYMRFDDYHYNNESRHELHVDAIKEENKDVNFGFLVYYHNSNVWEIDGGPFTHQVINKMQSAIDYFKTKNKHLIKD